MLNNISAVGKSGRDISIGQVDYEAKKLQLWVYHTRMIRTEGKEYAEILDFDLKPYKDFDNIELVDIDWDYRYYIAMKDFKKVKIVDGVRKVRVDKLKMTK